MSEAVTELHCRIEDVEIAIPGQLAAACKHKPERSEWLASLPGTIDDLRTRWALHFGSPFETASCAWVAPVRQNGRNAVLKVGMPHMEGVDELPGLQIWNGDPTVQIFDADQVRNAMLLEACEPGTPLRWLPEENQDVIVAEMLRRCWRRPSGPYPFRTLSRQLAYWAQETKTQSSRWTDGGLGLGGSPAVRRIINTVTHGCSADDRSARWKYSEGTTRTVAGH